MWAKRDAVKEDPKIAPLLDTATQIARASGGSPQSSIALVARVVTVRELAPDMEAKMTVAAATVLELRDRRKRPDFQLISHRFEVSADELRAVSKALEEQRDSAKKGILRSEPGLAISMPKPRVPNQKKADAQQAILRFAVSEEWKEPIKQATDFLVSLKFKRQASRGVAALAKAAYDAGLVEGRSPAVVTAAAASIIAVKYGKNPGDWSRIADRLNLEDSEELKATATSIVAKMQFPTKVYRFFGIDRGRVNVPISEEEKKAIQTPHSERDLGKMIRRRTEEIAAGLVEKTQKSVTDTLSEKIGKEARGLARRLSREFDRTVRSAARQTARELKRQVTELAEQIKAERLEELKKGLLRSAPLRGSESGTPINATLPNRLSIQLQQTSLEREVRTINGIGMLSELAGRLKKTDHIPEHLESIAGDMIGKYYALDRFVPQAEGGNGDTMAIAAAAIYYAGHRTHMKVGVDKIISVAGISKNEMYLGLSTLSEVLRLDILPDVTERGLKELAKRFHTGEDTTLKARSFFMTALNRGAVTGDNEQAMLAASYFTAAKIVDSGIKKQPGQKYPEVDRDELIDHMSIKAVELREAIRKLVFAVDIPEKHRALVL